jgi:chromosome segregation ATPase
MRLLHLKAMAFKGLRHFERDFGGENADIYGDNATGKTSVYDAFLWLLFGKDSAGRADFSIKPLDAAGRSTGEEVRVEARLELGDGSTLTLAKTYRERWERRRGEAEQAFTGHETVPEIDGTPVKVGDYKARVDELIPEELFRLLTSPYAFAGLPKDKARKVLLDMVGGISEDEIIASDPALAGLSARGHRTVAEYRQASQASARTITQELKQLPARIDEAQRSKVPAADIEALRARIESLRADREALQEQLAASQDGRVATLKAEIAGVEKELEAIERERLSAGRAYLAEQAEAKAATLRPLARAEEQIGVDLRLLRGDIARCTDALSGAQKGLEAARAEWTAENERDVAVQTACPTCGQDLPDDAVDKAIDHMQAERDAKLSHIQKQGEDFGKRAAGFEQELQELQVKALTLQAQQAEAHARYQYAADYQIPPFYDGAFAARKVEISARLGELHEALGQLMQGNDQAEALRAEIARIDGVIAGLERDVAAQVNNARVDERVRELTEQQQRLGAELSDAERAVILCEDYTRAMARFIEGKVNRLFDFVGFRLFVEQINGGLADACDVVVDGVPWSDLNHAMQVNAGLDIIKALSRHYGHTAPIFIDNAESVVRLADPGAQVIRLVVSGADPVLRIERAEAQKEDVA